MTGATLVRVAREGDIAKIVLDRPQAKNALSRQLAEELTAAFEGAAQDPDVRAVLLAGEGSDFCAGADLNEMKASGEAPRADNLADAKRLARMFRAVHSFSGPVVARVQGNAFGGGVGLIAACDMAVISGASQFAFSEVRLGILPAIISPYVVRKIGESNARRYFLTGERFGAEEALAMGLASKVSPANELDAAVDEMMRHLLQGSPDAQRRIKALLEMVASTSIEEAQERTPAIIADARASGEGREGLRAFVEKRKPAWARERGEDS
jgi:methylglutaconyl-CoA hydratase